MIKWMPPIWDNKDLHTPNLMIIQKQNYTNFFSGVGLAHKYP